MRNTRSGRCAVLIPAPSLMLENASYIKRVIFPLEILPWVVLAVTAFNAAVSLVALGVFYLVVLGLPPPTAVLTLSPQGSVAATVGRARPSAGERTD